MAAKRQNVQEVSAAEKTRVLIVDDHAIVRQGLIQVLNAQHDIVVCGEAEDAPQALALLESTAPGLVVCDVSLKGRNGIELVKDIHSRRPNLPVLVLSMYDESLYAERALRAGARGYIMKQEVLGKLMEAIRRVLSGEIYLSDRFASAMVRKALDGKSTASSPFRDLSDRELEVFQYIGEGLPTREIAERLFLSVKTIETHREHIKAKLGLKSSSQLLRYAIEHAVNPGLQESIAEATKP
jgi:DNA-binding NarL/FixJ family response regulator